MSARNGRNPARGFSLLELIIVVAITLIVAAIAIPQVMSAVQTFKLRSAASGLSGAVQKCRMLAVARNARCPGTPCSQTGYYSVTVINSWTTVFVDLDGSGTINRSEENTTVLQLPVHMAIDTSGAHPSDATINDGLSVVETVLPRFNARGLPCFVVSGTCSVVPGNMYISYVRQDRPAGGTGWAAITVTPAGRVRVWTWGGSSWE